MNYEAHFDKDEYPELNQRLFLPLRESGQMNADPSGWLDTHSKVSEDELFPPEIQKYYSDFYNQLNPIKKNITPMMSAWENIELSTENITLCHSATVGSAIALAFLISKGIKTVILETPCYFATFYQAQAFGMNIIRIPTFKEDDFNFSVPHEIISKNSPCAIFITQPRTALGTNQNVQHLINLVKQLDEKSYLIIDEATEQLFPSSLHELNFNAFHNVIKIRSMFKGLGINGVRLACLIHHEKHRKQIAEEMEVMQGALDLHSLKLAMKMGENVERFKSLLGVANNQVISLRKKAELQIKRSNCEVSPIINGYIGCAIIKLPSENRRNEFLEYCANSRMPVIIGSSMGFARHKGYEFVRLNYFNRENHILKGLEIMASFQ
ncbi:MAG TPA: aminotransferase class I/II-fold pyridoxal phosphate-dependent enzyme [Bacteroidia bacterium]|nr:aminotransferase class I/II-fold pyridoxal phosphate-dependent enzyme [Bacteroidia bacterium]